MSRINIPLEALTSRLNLGSRFEGVRSQSLTSRFANLKPISEFLDLKRLSKPANFGEVQSRVNYNLSYFSSNYFAVALMLTIYSLLTNFALLFDMVFMGVGLFAIKKLDGRELELGFTRLTTSQLYTGLFIIGVPVFIWASPIATALWLVGAIGARPGKRKSGLGRQAQQREENQRFEEINSDEDDGQGVGLDGAFVSDELQFTGANMGRRSRRRQMFDDRTSSESSGDDHGLDDGVGGTMQIALRDKEELLVQKALERIRRAQMLGRTNVKLTQREIDALERKRRNNEAERARKKPDIKKADRRRSSGQSRDASREQKSRRKSKGYFPLYDGEGPSSSRRATPPGILVPGPAGVPAYSPMGYYPPITAPQGGSSRSGSRSASSHSLAQASPPLPRAHKQRYSLGPDLAQPLPAPRSPQSSRRLPDDPNWLPRPRSSSSISSQPYPPDQYQAYSPPLPQIPHQYSQGRRVVSSPQSDLQYPRIRGEPQARSSEPSSLHREHSRQSSPERSESEEETASDDDEGDGVQVDVVPYSQGYGVSVRPEGARERQRRGQR
ncbi:MAG: hypothetical protein ASARMPRED_007411 [Alectoria sarmentosa]|nr:MAG: hypothetical protein ASARMPRED_007411 [Alectoria sarmentosa]